MGITDVFIMVVGVKKIRPPCGENKRVYYTIEVSSQWNEEKRV